MKFQVIFLALLGLCCFSEADLGNSNPPTGTCLCVTATSLNIRRGGGTSYGIIGSLSNGQCAQYRGGKTTANGYTWYSINYNGQTGWAAGLYLVVGLASRCSVSPPPAPGGVCSANGGPFNQACLDCMCKVESNCRAIGCVMDAGSLSCGFYQIKNPYYTDCRTPGTSWQSCANDRTCATTCVRNYMNRYYRTCTGTASPQCCEQAARIHNGGPGGCRSSATLVYWNRVKQCLMGSTG